MSQDSKKLGKKKTVPKKQPIRKVPCPLCQKEYPATAKSMGKHIRLKHADMADKVIWAQLGIDSTIRFFCRFCHTLTGNPQMGKCEGCMMPNKMVIMFLGKINETLVEMSNEIVELNAAVTVYTDTGEDSEEEEPVEAEEEEEEPEEEEE